MNATSSAARYFPRERTNSLEPESPDAVSVPVGFVRESHILHAGSKQSSLELPVENSTSTTRPVSAIPKFGASFSSQQDYRLASRNAGSKHTQKSAFLGTESWRSSPLRRLGHWRRILSRTPIRISWLIHPKNLAVIMLVAHSVLAPLLIRITRLRASHAPDGEAYLTSVAVFFGEILKFFCSLLLSFLEVNKSAKLWLQRMSDSVFGRPAEVVAVSTVSLLYSIQNVLIYVVLTYVNAGTFQVTYQVRILLTAVLSLVMLSRRISISQWLWIGILTFGVALVEMPSGWPPIQSSQNPEGLMSLASEAKTREVPSPVFRFGLVLLPCFTSAFSGVFFERLLKQSPVSIWFRNVQLAFFGTICAFGFVLCDRNLIYQHGLLQGYNGLVWTTLIVQALGGLIIAAVLKYADNIIKCFGNATGLVLSVFISSIVLRDATLSPTYLIGTMLVVFATFAYGTNLPLLRNSRSTTHQEDQTRPSNKLAS